MVENVDLFEVFSCFQTFLQEVGVSSDVVSFSFNEDKLKEVTFDTQSVFANLKKLYALMQGIVQKSENISTTGDSENVQNNQEQRMVKKMKFDNSKQSNIKQVGEIPAVDPKLVQVTANKAEIERRISAFIQRKQADVDMLNKREFCNVVDVSDTNAGTSGCARTDSVFVSRLGHTSHIKVITDKDENVSHESQALGNVSGMRKSSESRLVRHSIFTDTTPGVEERLWNVEQHLSCVSGKPVPHDVYDRLKRVEEKILFLEGLSPEYFSQNIDLRCQAPTYRETAELAPGTSTLSQELSLDQIDARIRCLRQALRSTTT